MKMTENLSSSGLAQIHSGDSSMLLRVCTNAFLFLPIPASNKMSQSRFPLLFCIAYDHNNLPTSVAFCTIVNLHTACLPSTIAKQHTMLKFGFWYLPGQELRVECEARLTEVFHIFDLEDMVIHMANRT